MKGIVGGCTAGVAALTIAPNLDVYPCARLRLKLGNLRSKSLRDIWGNCSKRLFFFKVGGG